MQIHAQNMGGSAYEWDLTPKKKIPGRCPRPQQRGLSPPVTPVLRPAQRTAHGASRGKNITHTQH